MSRPHTGPENTKSQATFEKRKFAVLVSLGLVDWMNNVDWINNKELKDASIASSGFPLSHDAPV